VNRDGTPWDPDRGLKPWWVLVDVCRAVGIVNPRDVASRLDDDEKDTVGIADGGNPDTRYTIVNRPGLTKVLRDSRKGPRP
jgi:prophage antirepressor-like protein